jgi:hypothetical protein
MERIDSCHSVWLFDTERMRFRRVPKETNVDAPALESDWEPYYGLEIAPESGAFAVALNESRTRLLRSWRHTDPCEHCSPGADLDVTAEVSLQPSDQTRG